MIIWSIKSKNWLPCRCQKHGFFSEDLPSKIRKIAHFWKMFQKTLQQLEHVSSTSCFGWVSEVTEEVVLGKTGSPRIFLIFSSIRSASLFMACLVYKDLFWVTQALMPLFRWVSNLWWLQSASKMDNNLFQLFWGQLRGEPWIEQMEICLICFLFWHALKGMSSADVRGLGLNIKSVYYYRKKEKKYVCFFSFDIKPPPPRGIIFSVLSVIVDGFHPSIPFVANEVDVCLCSSQ